MSLFKMPIEQSCLQIVSRLGEGTQGAADLVEDTENDRLIVRKTIGPPQREMALQEIHFLREWSVRHPRIVDVFDYQIETEKEGGNQLIFMEYCEGGDLNQYVKGQTEEDFLARQTNHLTRDPSFTAI